MYYTEQLPLSHFCKKLMFCLWKKQGLNSFIPMVSPFRLFEQLNLLNFFPSYSILFSKMHLPVSYYLSEFIIQI